MGKKILIATVLLVTVLVVILAFQNLEPVGVRLFFKTVQVSPSVLILLSWAAGALTSRPLARLILRLLSHPPEPKSSSGPGVR